MQKRGLKITQERQSMFAARGKRAEENVKADQNQAAGKPAAEEFSKN